MKRATPKKAFVLAAGFGTRLLPLTREVPKPLLPVWDRPVLEHALQMLRRWGVEHVVVNLHHRADRLLHYFRHRPADGLCISLSFEPQILGTGGALRNVEWFFADDEPVWLVNGDVLADLDPRPLLRAYDAKKTIAVAWVQSESGPRSVEVRRGRIDNFRSAAPGTRGTATFTGVQILNPRLLDRASGYVPQDVGFYGLIEAYERARQDGWTVAGVPTRDGFWADIGTPEQFLAAHRDTLQRWREKRPGAVLVGAAARRRMSRLRAQGVVVEGFASVSAEAPIERGAVLRDAVVLAGAHIRRGASVNSAIVGPGATVAQAVTRLAVRGEAALDENERRAVHALGWLPSSVTAVALSPRGSARTFIRLQRGRQSAMLVHYDPERTENTYYARHAHFLRRLGVPVPRVLVDHAANAVTIFEDLGDRTAGALIESGDAAAAERLYREVLDVMRVFHERGARAARRERIPLMPHFRPRLYRWERELFAEHLLRRRLKLSARTVRGLMDDLATVSRRLKRAPLALVHRDLQSSNILVKNNRPYLIDFQGMRFGPAVYDLASLLCDPYVRLERTQVDRLLEHYAGQAADGAAIRRLFGYAALQRLAQALGAFGRLSEKAETAGFAQHIPAALGRMREAMERVDGLPHLRVFLDRG